MLYHSASLNGVLFFQAAPVKVQKLSFAQGKTTELDLNLAIQPCPGPEVEFCLRENSRFRAELGLVRFRIPVPKM